MNLIFIHTAIGFLALTFGYPYGGAVFISIMAPYLIFMVYKCDARYLPALILHCASESTATSIVFTGFMIMSILKYKELVKFNLRLLFWIVVGLLPVFIWLVVVSITKHDMYPPLAIAEAWYYLSFFAFFYGVLIMNSFSEKVIYAIYVTLLVSWGLYSTGAIEFTRIVVGFTFLFSSALALFIVRKSKNPVLLILSLLAFISILFAKEDTTLTMLIVSIMSLVVVIFYYKGKSTLIQRMTGILPFILIIIIYIYGINSYLSAEKVSPPIKSNITDWHSFKNWVHWKFYFDRAPFWAGGLKQILEYKHLFPIPEMPDIIAKLGRGKELEITFGSHTTMIELIRRYGIISGGLLNIVLIYTVLISRRTLKLGELNPFFVPLFTMAIVTTIILTLAGQYQILPGFAILTLGILGIGYGISNQNDLKTDI